MAAQDTHSDLLDELLSKLTRDELVGYRADAIDATTLARFPALFSLDTPSVWVDVPQLQKWVIRRAQLPFKDAQMRLATPRKTKVKIEAVKSENDVIDLAATPVLNSRRKRARNPLVDVNPDVIVISSDSETEVPPKKIKTERGSIATKVARRSITTDVKIITRELKVSRVEYIDELPRCWPTLEERVAYIIDLSAEDRDWEDDLGDPIGMDWVIREHDQDNWGGSGGHRADESKCPKVELLGQRCQHIVLKCQGCYTCDRLDPELLHDCIRREYDPEQMRHVWDAERQINEVQGSSVINMTAVFYNHIRGHTCLHEGVVCGGDAVMRAWKKKDQSLDGKRYFIGCSAWKRENPNHRFIPIPYNVDEDALLGMLQNRGDVVEGDVSAKCAMVVPRRIGAKMKQCPYPHSEDGQVVTGQMVVRGCAATIDVFVPLDMTDHRACVVPRVQPHNHPVYPQRKLTAAAKRSYSEAVETFGAMGATVGKIDKAASTRKILGGISPRKFHPGLGQRRTKERIIKKLKDKEAPEGFGLPGVLARKEQQKALAPEEQYIQRISDTAGIQLVVTMLPRLAAKMHSVRASLHDNTYKRTFGKWKEWEVVIWDDRLNMRITVARIYCDSETADAFELIWTAFHEVLEEITGKPLKLWAFHKEGNFFAYIVDGDAGQAIGLGKYLCKINDPTVSGIHETDPAVLVQYVLKTCWTHCTKNLDKLATHLDNPADVKYIRSFEHMSTDAEVEEFREWCRSHSTKAVRDWYENKIRHRWYLPSLNPHLSRMRADHWSLVPKNTNFGESAHAHTNFYTGTGHSLLAAIDAAYQYDRQREEDMLLAEEHCLLRNSRNTVAHRMQHNAIRAAGRAQSVQERASDAEKAQELEGLTERLHSELESRRPPSLLTSEERNASLQRTKIIQARVDILRQEGVTLRRGRKPKTSSPAPSQLPPASQPRSSLTQLQMPPPAQTDSHPGLDADLEPPTFEWTSTPAPGVNTFGFDFEMEPQMDGSMAGPSHFPGALGWTGETYGMGF